MARKIHVLCVAYERPIELISICCQFLVQTNPNWELTIMYDGKPPDEVVSNMSLFKDRRIHFRHSKERNGEWGHPNRDLMLKQVRSKKNDFILLTNDDNMYVPIFIDAMFSVINDNVGFVMCDVLHSYIGFKVMKTELKENHIDMGSFIVRSDIAKEVGFKHRNFSADGKYAEECGKSCYDNKLEILHVENPLFIHC